MVSVHQKAMAKISRKNIKSRGAVAQWEELETEESVSG
jgi:hypothetical protein